MKRYHILGLVFLIALIIRLGGIIISTFAGFNPFIHGQVQSHEARAAEIANALPSISFNYGRTTDASVISFTSPTDRWGLLLSPFWLFPGPSALYAQLGIALIGSLAVVNVYLIGEHYHSKQAGILAMLPLAVFPSYVFMHSVVQREAMVLFGLTTAFVLIFLPNRYFSLRMTYILAGITLFLPGYLRFPNIPLILFISVATISFAFLGSNRFSVRRKLQAVISTSVIGASTILVFVTTFLTNRPVEFLASVRARRTRGRASYLEGVVPESIPEFAAFSWVSAVYFLYTPFPWHVERIDDFVIMLESVLGIGFTLFAVLGVLILKERSLSATVALVLGILLFSVFYGFGTGNYGTGLRHRQVIYWAIFILGAIGFSSKVRFRYRLSALKGNTKN